MEQKELKKKIAEVEEQVEILPKKKKYKGYKRGFTRKYTRFK